MRNRETPRRRLSPSRVSRGVGETKLKPSPPPPSQHPRPLASAGTTGTCPARCSRARSAAAACTTLCCTCARSRPTSTGGTSRAGAGTASTRSTSRWRTGAARARATGRTTRPRPPRTPTTTTAAAPSAAVAAARAAADDAARRIATSAPIFHDLLGNYFVQTAARLGFRLTDDFNRPGGREGVGYYQFNIRDGVRESAASVRLGPPCARRCSSSSATRRGRRARGVRLGQPAGRRGRRGRGGRRRRRAHGRAGRASPPPRNLHLWTRTHVQRLTWRKVAGGALAAAGVEYERARRDGTLETGTLKLARGAKVVLTAGAIMTPHLLHKSGVGEPTAPRARASRPRPRPPRRARSSTSARACRTTPRSG